MIKTSKYRTTPLANTYTTTDSKLTNDELAKAIGITLQRLEIYSVKSDPEILKATKQHYIALVAEELRRTKIE